MMRKLLFLFLVLFCFNLSAQDANHVITLSPLGVLNKARVKYEKPLDGNFSIGTFASYYYGLYKGPQIAPLGRFYVNNEAPDGFYLQLKGVLGIHSRNYSINDPVSQGTIFEYRQDFISYGAGFGIGYQILTGSNENFVIDLGLGFKYMTPVPNPDASEIGTTVLNAVDNAVYYTTGPGSFFDGLVAIGIAF